MFPPASVEDEWPSPRAGSTPTRAGLQTIQSFTSLYDQDEHTGAFVVVPRRASDHLGVTQRVYEDKWTIPTRSF